MKYTYLVVLAATIVIALNGCSPLDFYQKNDSNAQNNESNKDGADVLFNERAVYGGFNPLETEKLQGQDVEIRFWVRGGLSPVRGLIISRKNNISSASYLPALGSSPGEPKVIDLTAAVSDWDGLLETLEREGVFDLPSGTDKADNATFNDGQLVTIEYARGSKSSGRYYCVEPCAQEGRLGRRVCRIMTVLQDSLGVKVMVSFP